MGRGCGGVEGEGAGVWGCVWRGEIDCGGGISFEGRCGGVDVRG